MKVELVVFNVNLKNDSNTVAKIMKWVETKAAHFLAHDKYSGSPLKIYQQKPTFEVEPALVIFAKVGMPHDVKALEYIFKNCVASPNELQYCPQTFPSLDQAIKRCEAYFNTAEYEIVDDHLFLYGMRGVYNLCHVAKEQLADCQPTFQSPNCWKYKHASRALSWYKNSNKCILKERLHANEAHISSLPIPDDFFG